MYIFFPRSYIVGHGLSLDNESVSNENFKISNMWYNNNVFKSMMSVVLFWNKISPPSMRKESLFRWSFSTTFNFVSVNEVNF